MSVLTPVSPASSVIEAAPPLTVTTCPTAIVEPETVLTTILVVAVVIAPLIVATVPSDPSNIIATSSDSATPAKALLSASFIVEVPSK